MKYNRVGLKTKVLCSVHRIHKPVATSIIQLENTSVQYPNVTRCTGKFYFCKKINKFVIYHVPVSKWKRIGKGTSLIAIDTNRISVSNLCPHGRRITPMYFGNVFISSSILRPFLLRRTTGRV